MTSNYNLITFLHGIGASGAQLMPLASPCDLLFHTSVSQPPILHFHNWRGHQWFSVEGNPKAPDRTASRRLRPPAQGRCAPR
jgi:phospholipase/carboxylesterase